MENDIVFSVKNTFRITELFLFRRISESYIFCLFVKRAYKFSILFALGINICSFLILYHLKVQILWTCKPRTVWRCALNNFPRIRSADVLLIVLLSWSFNRETWNFYFIFDGSKGYSSSYFSRFIILLNFFRKLKARFASKRVSPQLLYMFTRCLIYRNAKNMYIMKIRYNVFRGLLLL